VPEPSPSVLNLLRLLIDATRRGTLSWKVAGESAFVATRPHGSVAVASLDGDGNPPFVFQLLNHENTVLEEVAEDRGAMNPGTRPSSSSAGWRVTTPSASPRRSLCGWPTSAGLTSLPKTQLRPTRAPRWTSSP
jgi:hypothetical protein